MIERGIVRKIFSIKEHMAFPSRVSISYNAILYVGVEMGNSGLQYINPEALVVGRVHSVSHWINLDQLNVAVHFQVDTYPQESNSSVDTVIYPLKNWAQDYKSSAGFKNSLNYMQKHFVKGRKISFLEPSTCLDFTIMMTTA